MLIDLNEHFRPRLYLVDAVVAMEGNGPTAGTPRPFGALLAGTNPHRIDLLCASLIGLKPENVPTLRAAAERGLTPLDPAQLCVAGDAAAFACPDFRIVQHGTGTDFGARGGAFGRLLGKDGGARAAHTAGPEADLVRRLRRVPRCLPGPCHYDRKRTGAY